MKNSYIRFFPALNGDSILLKINDYVMLIDGGYVNTFNKYIKPALVEINSKDISLNHVVVTHIDKDHISGIIKLLNDNSIKPFIQIDNIWHNSFKHIKQFNPDVIFYGKSLSELKTGYILQEEESEKVKDISAVQGSTLASILLKSTYTWNAEYDNKAISTDNKSTIKLTDKITLKLLSPSQEKLSALNLDWKKELYQKGYSTTEDLDQFSEDAFESLVANQKEQKLLKKQNVSTSKLDIDALSRTTFFEDKASANGSSIAFILESDEKKLLFLADSHPSIIIENLKLHYNQKDFPLYFDMIKLSHHGSQKNTNLDLLKMINSRHYIFSTNGKSHDHPDIETIGRIISQKTTFTKELNFTYPLESIKAFKDEELMEKYNYQIVEGNGLEPLKFDL